MTRPSRHCRPSRHHPGARSRTRSHWGAVALMLLAGAALVRNGAEGSGPPQTDAASAARGATTVPSRAPAAELPAARVRRILIPAIGLDAPVTAVGSDRAGWINAPPAENKNLAGWYTGSVSPGERGSAIIVGHVDNRAGPAVFFSLGALRKDAQIDVLRTDGRTAVFDVYGIETFMNRASRPTGSTAARTAPSFASSPAVAPTRSRPGTTGTWSFSPG